MRLQKIRTSWKGKFDAYMVFKPEYQENNDIAYATGFSGSTAVFLQTKKKNYLLHDFRYGERARKEVRKEITLLELRPMQNFYDAITYLFKKQKIRKVAIEDYTPYSILKKLRQAVKGVTFTPVPCIIGRVRAIKEESEMATIREAQQLTDELFSSLLHSLKPGKQTEKEIALAIEAWAIQRGVESLAFPAIVAAGKHTAIPHHAPTDHKIPKRGPLLIDFGIRWKGYSSDLTRTIWIGKKPDTVFVKVYQTVLQAQELGVEACVFTSRKKASEVDAAARKVIDSSSFKGRFGHGLGHGVGMDIHESPSLNPKSKDILHGNEVVTIEPGIYLEGQWGVRIEDVVVTGSGEVLTKAPKTFITL